MRRFLSSLLLLLAGGCSFPVPVDPTPPAPIPTPPQPPPQPQPTPPPTPPPDEVAVAKWDAVTVGMTEAEVVALVGKSAHRSIVGPGFLALGYYIRKDGASRYVEAVFGKDGKVASKNLW